MAYHKVNPLLAKTMYLLFAKLVFQAEEIHKENLNEKSYIFVPNHTNNYDGYLMWSLLSKNYDLDTFMYKEFWENYPQYAKYMPLFNVNPITRDKLVISELMDELKLLKNPDHSLMIFTQGRHVNPEMIKNFKEAHLDTLPLGAFYLSLMTGKPLMPIYLETQERFTKNAVVYGEAIDPKMYGITNSRNRKEVSIEMARNWIEQIIKMHEEVKNGNRPLHKYRLREHYYDSYGKERDLKDPNRIIKYIDSVKELEKISIETGITDIDELGRISLVPKIYFDEIKEAYNTYNNHLKRR